MRRAMAALPVPANYGLFDGRDVPEGLAISRQGRHQGDARSLSIAAASILAKVARDRMMARAALAWPATVSRIMPAMARRAILRPCGSSAPARCTG